MKKQLELFKEEKNVVEPPKVIDVLGKKFEVVLLKDEEEKDSDGYMELSEQRIGIRLHKAMDYNHDTLFHELTHAVDEIMHLKLKEHQVHILAAGLIAVLKQNKELRDWLFPNE